MLKSTFRDTEICLRKHSITRRFTKGQNFWPYFANATQNSIINIIFEYLCNEDSQMGTAFGLLVRLDCMMLLYFLSGLMESNTMYDEPACLRGFYTLLDILFRTRCADRRERTAELRHKFETQSKPQKLEDIKTNYRNCRSRMYVYLALSTGN